MVNNLTAVAMTTGEVRLQSDGTPWRPLVHIEDISRAFLAMLEAPRELVHDEAFNVGRAQDNVQIRQIAEMVRDAVPGSTVTLAEDAGPDLRDYRVDFAKLTQVNLASRERDPGSRRDLYHVHEKVWHEAIVHREGARRRPVLGDRHRPRPDDHRAQGGRRRPPPR